MNTALVAPQMVINSRMLYFGWIPEDRDGLRRLLPPGLRPIDNGQVFMNQYVVDSADQTSGFGAYSLTYMGIDLDRTAPDGQTPARWWTNYLNSSAGVREYAMRRGVPATSGRTTLELREGSIIATTFADDTPIIRSTARIGPPAATASGQLSYITDVQGRLVEGIYPWIATLTDPWEVTSLEFLEPAHPVYALRPALPLTITWGFYSPNASFCYPGGESVIS